MTLRKWAKSVAIAGALTGGLSIGSCCMDKEGTHGLLYVLGTGLGIALYAPSAYFLDATKNRSENRGQLELYRD